MSDPIDEALDALDEGRPELALERVVALAATEPERWIVTCAAYVELGELAPAREALEQLGALTGPDDLDRLWAHASVSLAEWRIDEARGSLERLVALESSAAVLERLSLCFDLAEDFERADALLAQAHALDPEAVPVPTRVSREEFDGIVGQALDALPAPCREALANVRVSIEPVPALSLMGSADLGETPPDILGLFSGFSRLDAPSEESAEMPPAIFLFQRNLERAAGTRAELLEEIRVTLYHEVGHLLGFDEEGVEAMGLG